MPSDMPSNVFGADLTAIVSRGSHAATLTRADGTTTVAGIDGILSVVQNNQKDIEPGWIPEYDALFVVPVANLPASLPLRGETFTIAAVVYQIMSFETDPSVIAINYKLGSNSK